MIIRGNHNKPKYNIKYVPKSKDLKVAVLSHFRFGRQCICIDEFNGADVIVDTGTEIIEVEIKVTKSDLVGGEKFKALKHKLYALGRAYARCHPNRYLFCVPTHLLEDALDWAEELNLKYGVMSFDTSGFERRLNFDRSLRAGDLIRTARRAKKLHEEYSMKQRWKIAKRATSKVITLLEKNQTSRFKQIKEAL